jgi:hypothetical protein
MKTLEGLSDFSDGLLEFSGMGFGTSGASVRPCGLDGGSSSRVPAAGRVRRIPFSQGWIVDASGSPSASPGEALVGGGAIGQNLDGLPGKVLDLPFGSPKPAGRHGALGSRGRALGT